MATLSSELSDGELMALFCAIIFTLIPPTIRVFWYHESRRSEGLTRHRQNSVKAKIS